MAGVSLADGLAAADEGSRSDAVGSTELPGSVELPGAQPEAATMIMAARTNVDAFIVT